MNLSVEGRQREAPLLVAVGVLVVRGEEADDVPEPTAAAHPRHHFCCCLVLHQHPTKLAGSSATWPSAAARGGKTPAAVVILHLGQTNLYKYL